MQVSTGPERPPIGKEKQVSLKQALVMLAGGFVALVALGITAGYLFFWDRPGPDKVDADVAHWQQVVAQNPSDDLAHVEVGWALYQKGKKQDALQHYRQAVELQPGNVGARYNMGLVLGDLGQFEEAAHHLKLIIEAMPRHEMAQFLLGEVYYKMNKLDEAYDHFHNVLVLYPTSANALYYQGMIHQQKGQMDQAVALWKEALSYDPKHSLTVTALNQANK